MNTRVYEDKIDINQDYAKDFWNNQGKKNIDLKVQKV